MNQALGRDLPSDEAVDRDSTACVGFAVAFRIGERRHAGVDVAAIAAKCEAQEPSRLVRMQTSACIWKIGKRARRCVENGKRLLVLRLEGSIACVRRYNVAAVGKKTAIEIGRLLMRFRMAGSFSNQLLAGEGRSMCGTTLGSGPIDSAQFGSDRFALKGKLAPEQKGGDENCRTNPEAP